ncbi:MAG TPA: 2-oxo-4-hydroxy-4-carboxy-5-ureidoimidazoline decarboxylase [Oceanospirillales bacterium]|nr:2-oxo-4-hydroxy-4-carboxy-5-ureidoimidazoline decarboxylase [Oceanospirillales bacterium]
MNIQQFNQLPATEAMAELQKCCGSENWIKAMLAQRPYSDKQSLHQSCDKVWATVSEKDILEAFSHHPQIGDVESLKKKFTSTANWASNEQQGAQQATDETLNALKKGNEDYLNKFGFIFIVCATGKSAQQMLDMLNERLSNDQAIELHIAAAEQNKISHLRLDKLLSD